MWNCEFVAKGALDNGDKDGWVGGAGWKRVEVKGCEGGGSVEGGGGWEADIHAGWYGSTEGAVVEEEVVDNVGFCWD